MAHPKILVGPGGAYNATTYALAGFRGKVPGKGREKGGTEKKVG